MLSLSLLKQTIKYNWVIWTAITAVMTILCIQFAALEMTQGLLFVIFYGMMTTILPGIYVLVTANKLISSQVDRGSMAYVLSTPTKRSKIALTQAVFLIGSLVLMFAILTVGHIIVNTVMPLDFATLGYPQLIGDLSNDMIIKINLSALMVCIGLAGVCFAFSGICNASKHTMGLSGTFVGVSILTNMLAMFGNLGVGGLDKFKYLTICSFYDYESVIFGGNEWIAQMIYPLAIALAAYVVGSVVFCKKDLPL